MADPIIIPDGPNDWLYRARLTWSGAVSTYSQNVLHFSSPGNNVADLGSNVRDALNSNMFEAMPTSFHLSQLSILKLSPDQEIAEVPVSGSLAGEAAAEDYDPAGAVLVHLTTGLGGRSRHGRVYVGPISQDVSYNGRIGNDPRDHMQNAWNAFITELQTKAPAIRLVVASLLHLDFRNVTSAVVKNKMVTQRRRQGRVI